MADLVGTIRAYDLSAFGSAVSVQDYRAVFPHAREHDPYLLCIASCFANLAAISHVSSLMTRQQRPPIDVAFCLERSLDTAFSATEIYRGIKAASRWLPAVRMAGIRHMSKQVIGLQAADLMAREVFKYYDNRGFRITRKPVIALADQITFHCWTRKNLEYIAANGGPANYSLQARFAERMMKTEATPLRGVQG
jgi:hypothetical protein